MNNALMQAQDVLLDKINQICGKFGLNNIMAQLYAILYLGNKPMSLDEMVERLKISKGSASINIRALERYGTVRKVWVKGSRKDYYEAESDISKVIVERAHSMAKNRLSEIENMINSSYEAFNSLNSAGADDRNLKIFKEKLDGLKALYDKAQGLFELFNTSFLAAITAAKPEDPKEEISYVSSADGLAPQE